MGASPSGEMKRAVSFDMAKETHRALYDFSRTLNLSEFVRQKLAEEMSRRKSRGVSVTMVADRSVATRI